MSVAVPSIGAGKFRYPGEVVSKILIEETASYLEQNRGRTSLKLIHFVIFDQQVYDVFQKCYKTNSAGAQSYDSTEEQFRSQAHRQLSRKQSISQSFPEERRADKDPCVFSFPHGLCLEVVQGDISSDDCDVVVNTTNKNLQLVGSGVAGALLKKGGWELQAVCDAVVSQGIMAEEGKVVTTPSTGELKCKTIFHIAFENKDSKNFIKTTHACLETAEKKAFTSIAFPAVGTGTHGYPAESAARAMVDAIKKFTENKPKHVKIIRIVLFDPRVYRQFSDIFNSMCKPRGGLLSYFYKGARVFLSVGKKLEYEQDEENDEEEIQEKEVQEKEGDYHRHRNVKDLIAVNSRSTFSLDSNIIIHIYGETEHSIMRAKEQLKVIIDTQFISENITDEKIVDFSGLIVQELVSLAKKHHVDIQFDEASQSVKLCGHQQYVLLIKDKVRDALSALTQEESKNVLYKTIRWERGSSNEEYDKELNFEIEIAYHKKDELDGIFNSEEHKIVIDFTKMEERNLVTGQVVKVCRKSLSQGMLKLSTTYTLI